MKSNDFLSNLLQVVGFLAAIIIALSQYFFSGNFKQFFIGYENLYSISNTVSLILCLAIILGIYGVRYSLDMRRYFSKSKKENYFRQLQKPAGNNTKDNISEPKYWTMVSLGFLSIFVSIILFGFLSQFKQPTVTSILYILFICTSVLSLAIFSIKIYIAQDFKNTEERIRKQTLDKINEYFAGNLHIVSERVNRDDWTHPSRMYIVQKDGVKYWVQADANDPNKFFSVEEMKNNDK